MFTNNSPKNPGRVVIMISGVTMLIDERGFSKEPEAAKCALEAGRWQAHEAKIKIKIKIKTTAAPNKLRSVRDTIICNGRVPLGPA